MTNTISPEAPQTDETWSEQHWNASQQSARIAAFISRNKDLRNADAAQMNADYVKFGTAFPVSGDHFAYRELDPATAESMSRD